MKLLTWFEQSWKTHTWFWILLLLGLMFRISLNSAVDSFDFYAFVMWAKYLTTHKIADLFEFLPDGYTPYPPLYYYVLWFLGRVISSLGVWSNKWLTYFIIRVPVFLADIGVYILVYNFTKKYITKTQAHISAAFYFLHPAIIYNTSIWGQVDSVVTLLGLGSILSLTKGRQFLGISLYAADILTKLQSLALLPLTGFLILRGHSKKKLAVIVVVVGILSLIPFLPVVFIKGIKWTWDYFFTIPNWYAYTSIYTYNLWAPFGFIVSDNTKLFGILQYKYIGIFLFWFVAYLILKPLTKSQNQKPILFMFAAFLLWYDFSFFATRIHSRYLIYSFGFFAPYFVLFPRLGMALSLLMIANFLLPLKTPWLTVLVQLLNTQAVIFIMVLYAFSIFIWAYTKYKNLIKMEATKHGFTK